MPKIGDSVTEWLELVIGQPLGELFAADLALCLFYGLA